MFRHTERSKNKNKARLESAANAIEFRQRFQSASKTDFHPRLFEKSSNTLSWPLFAIMFKLYCIYDTVLDENFSMELPIIGRRITG
mmetsp:Transcript_6099/g.14809  ORF Transcript_6099/g.14809 Transcript_6099/m.14809 type:complete len:86 (-) Transcript_6099:3772-4029(-)